jgi:hypothetical protein
VTRSNGPSVESGRVGNWRAANHSRMAVVALCLLFPLIPVDRAQANPTKVLLIGDSLTHPAPDRQSKVSIEIYSDTLAGKLGPWMYPYMRRKQVPKRFDAPIAKHLIDTLAARLLKLAKAHPGRFIVADTRGAAIQEGGASPQRARIPTACSRLA